MIDIHNHILPDIDDGPRTIEESVALCDLFIQQGVQTVVATPHVFDVRYPNPTTEQIESRLNEVRERMAGRLEILCGSEIRLVPEVTTILGRKELFIDRTSYLLVELPSKVVPVGIERLFFNLTASGVRPIIAHPERTTVFLDNARKLEQLIGMGCLAHLDAPSLLNERSPVFKIALRWIEAGLVHFVASDAHRADWRPPQLGAAYSCIKREFGDQWAQALFVENPQAIIRGEDVFSGYDERPARPTLLGWIQKRLRR